MTLDPGDYLYCRHSVSYFLACYEDKHTKSTDTLATPATLTCLIDIRYWMYITSNIYIYNYINTKSNKTLQHCEYNLDKDEITIKTNHLSLVPKQSSTIRFNAVYAVHAFPSPSFSCVLLPIIRPELFLYDTT